MSFGIFTARGLIQFYPVPFVWLLLLRYVCTYPIPYRMYNLVSWCQLFRMCVCIAYRLVLLLFHIPYPASYWATRDGHGNERVYIAIGCACDIFALCTVHTRTTIIISLFFGGGATTNFFLICCCCCCRFLLGPRCFCSTTITTIR